MWGGCRPAGAPSEGHLRQVKAAQSLEGSRALHPQTGQIPREPRRDLARGPPQGVPHPRPGKPHPDPLPLEGARLSRPPSSPFSALRIPLFPPGQSAAWTQAPHPGRHERFPCSPCQDFKIKTRRGGSLNKNRKLDFLKSLLQAELRVRVLKRRRRRKSPEMQSWRRFCRCNPGSAADLGADFGAAAVNTRRAGRRQTRPPIHEPGARAPHSSSPALSSPGPRTPGRACRVRVPGQSACPSPRAFVGARELAPLRRTQPAARLGRPLVPLACAQGRAHSAERSPPPAPRRVHARPSLRWKRSRDSAA